MAQIGVGVIGAGTWGTLHSQVYAADARCRLAAICDLNEGRARALAEATGAEAVYLDWQALLEKADLQAVSIVTPDFAHTEIAVAAAEAGKDILIEKPLATTSLDCVRIIDAASRNGVRLMIDFHNRWNPPFADLKTALEAGELGRPRHVNYVLNDTIYVPTEYLPWAGRSSVLWFLGPHVVDTLRWLLGSEVTRVFAQKGEGLLTSQGLDTADFYKYMLTFKNGVVASMENSWILPEGERNIFNLKFALVGEAGSYYINASDAGWAQKFSAEQATCPELAGNLLIQGKRQGFMLESIRHFIDCLAEGSEPAVTGRDGLEATRVLEAIEASCARGLPVSLKEFGGNI